MEAILEGEFGGALFEQEAEDVAVAADCGLGPLRRLSAL